MSTELNEGTIAGILGDWFCEEPEGYEAGVAKFYTWLDEQREDAHIEALKGILGQLLIREDFLVQTTDDSSFVQGFRSARQRVEHATITLKAVYANRRRFAARDAAKKEAEQV